MEIHRIDTSSSDTDVAMGDNSFGTYDIKDFRGVLVIGLIGTVADVVSSEGQSQKPSVDGQGRSSEEILFSDENIIQVGIVKNGRPAQMISLRSGSKYTLLEKGDGKTDLQIRYQVQNAGFIEAVEYALGEMSLEF